MASLTALIDAFVASPEPDRATLARLAFRIDDPVPRDLSVIDPEDLDASLSAPR